VRILACDLGALDSAQRARYSALRAELAARRLDAREVADGYVFSYPGEPDVITHLAELVTLERRCCPFFDFALEVSAGASQVRLKIGGSPDVKEFLRSQLA
jgi:hypothetical protein